MAYDLVHSIDEVFYRHECAETRYQQEARERADDGGADHMEKILPGLYLGRDARTGLIVVSDNSETYAYLPEDLIRCEVAGVAAQSEYAEDISASRILDWMIDEGYPIHPDYGPRIVAAIESGDVYYSTPGVLDMETTLEAVAPEMN